MKTLKPFEETKTIAIDDKTNVPVVDLPSALRKQIEIYDDLRLTAANLEYQTYVNSLALAMLHLQIKKSTTELLAKKTSPSEDDTIKFVETETPSN
jgi:hypothetical protein